MSHPLHQFSFCPVCGSPSFVAKDEKANYCTACGFVYYFNPSAAVACFVKNRQGELLVVRRAKEPAKGTLDLPGGFVDMHETAEEAAGREVKEETNLTITNCNYLFSIPNIYTYSGFDVHTLDLFFECQVETFDGASAEDDAAEVLILKPTELDRNAFGLTSIQEGVRRYSLNP